MILDLKAIFAKPGSSLAVNFALDLAELEFSGETPLKKPVPVVGSVFNRAGIVTVDVACSVEFSAPCDRCGKDAVNCYSLEINRVLVTEISDETDDELILIPDMQLDIEELCTTEIVLSLPMKHLCKPDCKGICPICGKDLNDSVCDCKKSATDPRLEVLAQLLED